MTTTTHDSPDRPQLHTDLPAPPGAAELGPWDAETNCRLFDGATQLIIRERLGADIEVTIVATQYADGRVEREITVDRLHRDNPISIADARRIVATLTTAMTKPNNR